MPPSISTIRPDAAADVSTRRDGTRAADGATDPQEVRKDRQLPDRFERSGLVSPAGAYVKAGSDGGGDPARVGAADEERERKARDAAAAEQAAKKAAGGAATDAEKHAQKGEDPFALKPVPEDPFAKARAEFTAKTEPMRTKLHETKTTRDPSPASDESTKATSDRDVAAAAAKKAEEAKTPVLTRWLSGGVDGGHEHTDDGCTYCQKAVSTFVRAK
jgi:hypothetical protein